MSVEKVFGMSVSGSLSHVWPASARINDDGALEMGHVPVSELTSKFGSPLYVIDEDLVRERARHIRDTFVEAAHSVGAQAEIYYAGKALLTAEVARWMYQEGLRIDVASAGEMIIAMAGGVPASALGLHGNNKSPEEISRAIVAGIGSIVIDSPFELERVALAAAAAGVTQAVRLRVNSGVHAHTHEFLATAHEDQKFGVSFDIAEDLVERIREHSHLEFLGLHCHIGSQIFEAGGFAESAARLLELHARLSVAGTVPELNLGGGFGIAYVDEDAPLTIDVIAREIVDTVKKTCDSFGIPVPTLVFEPGRWIVGPAGITVYTVGTVKSVQLNDGRVRHYVSVDGGMSDNARPALYGARYSSRIANRSSSVPSTLSRVSGKHCESGDILIDEAQLPGDVRPGDVLAVAATGAYCYSLSSTYNAIPRLPIVAVSGGRAREIVRRETEADLLSRDLGVVKETQ